MSRIKLKRHQNKVIISFRNDLFDDDPDVIAAGAGDTEVSIFDLIFGVIAFITDEKVTIALDQDSNQLEYKKKKRFRKPDTKMYAFSDVRSLRLDVYNKRGILNVETRDNARLLFSPNLSRRKANKVSRVVAEILNIEPEIREPSKTGIQLE